MSALVTTCRRTLYHLRPQAFRALGSRVREPPPPSFPWRREPIPLDSRPRHSRAGGNLRVGLRSYEIGASPPRLSPARGVAQRSPQAGTQGLGGPQPGDRRTTVTPKSPTSVIPAKAGIQGRGSPGSSGRVSDVRERRSYVERSMSRVSCPILFQSVPFLSGRWNTLPKNGTCGVPRVVSGAEQGGTKWNRGVPSDAERPNCDSCDLVMYMIRSRGSPSPQSSPVECPVEGEEAGRRQLASRLDAIGEYDSTNVLLCAEVLVSGNCFRLE